MEAPTTAEDLAHFERLRAQLQELHRGVQADMARLDTMLRAKLREIEPPPGQPDAP